MFRSFFGFSIAVLMLSLPVKAQMTADDILNKPELTDLSDQDVDADTELIRALQEAAIKPAKFVSSVDKITLESLVGKEIGQSFQIRNSGQREAKILSVNTVGIFEGFDLKHDCPEIVEAGQFCTISVKFVSESPTNFQSAIVIAVNAKDQSEVNIPFTISVKTPPRVVEVVKPTVTIKPRSEPKPIKTTPTSHKIARSYFSYMGGMMADRRGGIVVIEGPKEKGRETFAGANYDEMDVVTVNHDDRYDDNIPYTNASLSVDRDRILTTDRVIKAILETPVSNVICGKTVAHVESDVYSATSSYPLIPAGSRVVGKCGSFINERVGIEWTRIITTDGRSISFELAADTRDAMGYGGALGRVIQPVFDRYVLPVISTLIDSGAGVVTAVYGEDEDVITDENGNVTSSKSAVNQGIGIITDDARTTAQAIIKDVRDVRKIAAIPAGSRIDIEINEDVYFTDSRKVVRVADMEFSLEKNHRGKARKDWPEKVALKPVSASYEGETVLIGGRSYVLEKVGEEAAGQGGDQQEGNGASVDDNQNLTIDQVVKETRGQKQKPQVGVK